MPRLLGVPGILLVTTLLACAPAVTNSDPLRTIDHIVVIYQENHSFDNLYGGWGEAGGQHVSGLTDPSPATTTQVAQDGSPLIADNGRDAAHPLGSGWTAGPTGTSTGTCAGPTAKNAAFPHCPAPLFQFHHQPLGYYADGTPGEPSTSPTSSGSCATQRGPTALRR